MSLVVLLGGARAGKSTLALEFAARWEGPVTYIATAEARDEEMAARIERHRSERDQGWKTIEEPIALVEALRGLDARDAAVVDCLTLWVANLLERESGEDAIMADANAAADLAAARSAPAIVVTNEVGLGIVPHTTAGRRYRDLLGAVNGAFVRRADEALLVVAGRALQLDRRP